MGTLLIVLLYLFKSSIAGMHVSMIDYVYCDDAISTEYAQTLADSFLLSEGESLRLDCGVCKFCSGMAKECHPKFDYEGWTIQRSRYLGYGGSTEGEINDIPYELPKIRMRLHERIWPGASEFPEPVDSFLRSDYPDATSSASFSRNESDSTPRTLAQNINLYILVAKTDQQAQMLRPPRKRNRFSRVQLTADTVHIRQTRTTDTGVYYCYWNGKRIKEWAVTVVKASEEPFRHISLPTYYDESIAASNRIAAMEGNGSSIFTFQGDGQPETLRPETLLDYNLRVYTDWGLWSECVPCIHLDGSGHSEISASATQMRVGTCRVHIVDTFHSVRPHPLAILVDATMRTYNKRGLPCRSHLITEAMHLYGPEILKRRPSELQQRQCAVTCSTFPKSERKQSFRFPTRVQLRVHEGEKLVVSCPIRGPLRGPITWYYSYSDREKLINLTTNALRKETIENYGSPSGYLITLLTPVNVSSLHRYTRGRCRLDPGESLAFAEVMTNPPNQEDRLHHLICIHGNPHSTREQGFSDWAGIIDIRVIPRSFTALFLGKLSQVVLLIIPFVLACGTFIIIILTIHIERKPNMRAATEGFTSKPPP